MKINIDQLKEDIVGAKLRQSEATKDIKRIEKDMNDFSNNKDSKLAELQSTLSALKKTQSRISVSVKTLQKELQSARLEAEQTGADLSATQEQLGEADSALRAQEVEVKSIREEQSQNKAGRQDSQLGAPADVLGCA